VREPRSGCGHKTLRDHSVATEDEDNWSAPRLWKCSACGKRDLWGDEWCWHGSLECPDCGHAVMNHVACSEICVRSLAPRSRR
jgi:DNA-directed RNA polymerase subunit RPC12/RpoP